MQDKPMRGKVPPLKDLVLLKPATHNKGRPKNDTISKLISKYMHKENDDPYYSCVAVSKCGWIRSGNAQLNRVLRHAASCKHLTDEQRGLAGSEAASSSLGAKLEKFSIVTPPSDNAPGPAAEAKTPVPGKAKSRLELDFTTAGRKELARKVDHCVMKLICVNGLIPHIIDSDEWKELMATLNSRYKPTPSTTFTQTYIPQEAAHVRQKQLAHLQQSQNLTLTFDGHTTRRNQSVYTVHVTTADRDSYFLDGHEGSTERHTAEWVAEKIMHARLRLLLLATMTTAHRHF
jgi:DNA-binding TFAR19-related protein (PDSD5 family)